jgi:hypothetical protein
LRRSEPPQNTPLRDSNQDTYLHGFAQPDAQQYPDPHADVAVFPHTD